ncbi:peptide ABC transporter ATP-binding protein [Streptococcus parasanguinis]|uniref:peptide ABC transporter substrate-binding protein n=1 Tax=Streptococcus parasanguinis TaxID=1318 RepID=UPI0012BBCD30|nr:peptide ABC transporter substrate-binding protein [Streptococcus parasanguinis]MTR54290.1 peptide ABC transporter ATP-binding protein [Streptococcus parasanguinis]MTR56230.1 peptide ABC transporter ATP-binding protein [Streptococcus parasanguinis]MTR60862.1 peptide ABC transporter ATP-binding protein [Streptococcus parasanguinis]MTR69887.1 peptide ABC transporter ATP-binding protein [Streptococcus parasanguinis]MTS02956.1 peptide ABC transporter ATP-binding protein [Streptococcus parasangui
MNKGKVLLATSALLLSAGVLAACSGGKSGSSGGQTFSYVYTQDPDTLDYSISNKKSTSEFTGNAVDGLLEVDKYGNLIPSLAKDWTVSKDGLTYTYKLRKGVKWMTSEGEEYGGEVKAQDFVTGLKHAADKKSSALYLVQKSVKGLDDYVSGKTKDFSTVGIKAIDDYTVQYTLSQPESFWNSKTTMGILMPVNEEFLKSKGDDYGQGTSPSSILYCGPYLIKSITSKSSAILEKNPTYWDAENVKINKVKLTYYDGQDSESLIRGFDNGDYTVARVFPNGSNYKSVEKKHKDDIVYTDQGSSTYNLSFNIDRQAYEITKKTTDAQKASTKKAILNKDFRQAIMFAFNRKAYVAQANGEAGANKVIRNTFTPPNFVQIDGKQFGDAVEKDLEAYGDEWKGVSVADGKDTLYNPTKAKEEFAKAKADLQAQGVEFPIHLDLPTSSTFTEGIKQAQSFKQSVESTLGAENIVIDLNMVSEDDLQRVTYFAENASQQDWDLNNNLGWGPDYTDPSSYIDITSGKSGENANSYFGFDAGTDNAAAKAAGFDEYDQLIEDAQKENTDVNKRYEKYAAAQAWLTDSALLIPIHSDGASPVVRKTVPYSAAFAWTGHKGQTFNYKYLEVQDKVVTAKDYDKARDQWKKEKEKSNKKAQEELEKHVK